VNSSRFERWERIEESSLMDMLLFLDLLQGGG